MRITEMETGVCEWMTREYIHSVITYHGILVKWVSFKIC